MKTILILTLAIAFLLSTNVGGAEPLKVLYLTKSSGFEHSVVKRENNQLSFSEKILVELGNKNGWQVECTKDASKINAENLNNYDVVIFYTSGDLTEAGTDGQPPMKSEGEQELIKWIQNGGGFIGIHPANDSFHSKGDKISDYVKMLGGEFATHGKQFKGKLEIVSKGHPALGNFPDGWETEEEWYLMKNMNKEIMHVLILLNPGEERKKQEMYNVPSYPIVWCHEFGKGRVVYNGLGHREDVWESSQYQELLKSNIIWASGQGPAQAEPNYQKVMPEK
ncbi:MAG TPA: ThuA domain-containing protein [Candidatus Hydrogenedens sp.]|nr:ThuA domain-containing protein [Candidatus Hydrogenedens sp.]HOK09178.1 ThuA domain-containing protein [Candidatus Hydrogenedens sp.]HOL19228.1 ThuA domain-containing protein [Candidatus Hydrogenedens sp.]HPP58945.1 ThuA domain-containing protein [Candidatus Hydrogenedens sp.]